MIRNALIVLAALVTLAALTPAAPQRGDDPKGGLGGEPDFEGKVLIVSVKDPVKGSVMQRARIQRLGGRAFLVGDYARQGDDDANVEEVLWFPVDDILQVRVFKSIEDVRKVYAAAEKK